MKFRPTLQSLESRETPSGTQPIDPTAPPEAPPPAQTPPPPDYPPLAPIH